MTAATERIEEISHMGRAAGLDFKYLTTRYTNTSKNLELANFAVLKKIAVECGLDGNEVDDILNSDSYAEDVRADELCGFDGCH